MATLCCDAVAEGLRTVQSTSLPDLREGFNMQRTILHMVLKLHHRITTGLVTTNGPVMGQSLGPPTLEVVMAGFEATMRLQEAVLTPDALTGGLGECTYGSAGIAVATVYATHNDSVLCVMRVRLVRLAEEAAMPYALLACITSCLSQAVVLQAVC